MTLHGGMYLLWYFLAVELIAAWPSVLYAQTDPQNVGTLSLVDATETLRQEFRETPVWRKGAVQVNERAKSLSDSSFSWAAGYIWSHPPIGASAPWPQPRMNFPAWTSNGYADADPNGDMISQIGEARSPLSWSGTLNLTVRKMPADLAAKINAPDPRDYMSASITSFPFAQRYGVFAMLAKLPSGHGIWPAFWLLPVDKSWPPEIDIMEVIGTEPTTLYTTVHLSGQIAHGHGTDTHLDLSASFHEYAVDWSSKEIDWYFDRKLVFSQPTPPELHKACYIIASLIVGRPHQWGGAPDSTTKLPATMRIASIRVWQRPNYLEPR